MSRYHTPTFGPYAGILCRDGVPVEVDPNYVPTIPVALPTDPTTEAADRYVRGIRGAAEAVYEAEKRYGGSPSIETCRDRVAQARRKKENT